MIIGNREGAYPPIVSEARREEARGLAAMEPIIVETSAGRTINGPSGDSDSDAHPPRIHRNSKTCPAFSRIAIPCNPLVSIASPRMAGSIVQPQSIR